MTDGSLEGPHRAAAEAFAVVGMYGDPTVPWSIALEAELTEPVAPGLMCTRLTELVAAHPNCGLPPAWQVVAESDWQRALDELMNTPYAENGPILRGACDAAGRRVVVGGHHGAVDGLGMLAMLAAVLDTDLRSRARGVASVAPRQSFSGLVRERLVEVLLHPPRRLRPRAGDGSSAGDWIVSAQVEGRVDTSLMVTALAALVERWDAGFQTRRPTTVAIGASRRPAGMRPLPDRDTTFLRVRVPSATGPERIRTVLQETAPEPDYPASRGGGFAPLAIRVFSSRLGSTALVSSLGVVLGGEEMLRSLRLYPAPSGPSGVAVGAINTGGTGTVTLRARRRDFCESAARELLAEYLTALAELQRGS